MALQGSLRDFSATEILQLIGMQQKTGCLVLERAAERILIFVTEGRIVSTRLPGMGSNDPLLRFLLETHRLSSEQHLGIVSIQRQSGRDLEDILLNGRYLESDELTACLERQILEDISGIVRWENGDYRFESTPTWDQPVHVRLSVEGAIIEAARRQDEARQRPAVFEDPGVLLGVRDLPDPDEPLADEERDLFGIIDGRHTLAEIVEAAPLTHSEAYEALDRMLRANWIEVVGRQDSVARPAEPVVLCTPIPVHASTVRHSFVQELLLAVLIAGCALGVYQSGRFIRPGIAVRSDDVFVTAQMRDMRYALELFHRERGNYPDRLEDLVADRWVSPTQLEIPGHQLYYHLAGTRQAYELRLEPQP